MHFTFGRSKLHWDMLFQIKLHKVALFSQIMASTPSMSDEKSRSSDSDSGIDTGSDSCNVSETTESLLSFDVSEEENIESQKTYWGSQLLGN